ncbi:MAG: hypothetical protein HC773_05640 [Scytonema sp. CRU_2_7]|nr:hypothetical protein [Scytonema sp. CRU_2_7]
MDDRIFVAIASYRDPELIPTIQDAIAMARNPDRSFWGLLPGSAGRNGRFRLYGGGASNFYSSYSIQGRGDG